MTGARVNKTQDVSTATKRHNFPLFIVSQKRDITARTLHLARSRSSEHLREITSSNRDEWQASQRGRLKIQAAWTVDAMCEIYGVIRVLHLSSHS